MEILLPKTSKCTLDRRFPDYVLSEVEIFRDLEVYSIAIETRKNVEGVTIDGVTSKDLDDAIWINKTDSGYILDVSISDPGSFIEKNSAIDLEAYSRLYTLYGETLNNPMIHPFLSEELLTLKELSKRPAITLRSFFDSSFRLNNFEVFKSTVNLKKRLTYSICNKAYINQFNTTRVPELNLYSFNVEEYLNNLRTLSCYLKSNRIGRKYLEYDLGPEEIVSEIMIFSNYQIAEFLEDHKITSMYRSHGFRSQSCNERAEYSVRNFGHKGLQVSSYSHFTSPIRRYGDLVLGRIVGSFVDGVKNPYSTEEVLNLCSFINSAADAISCQSRFELECEVNFEMIYTPSQIDMEVLSYNYLSGSHFNIIKDQLENNRGSINFMTSLLLDEGKTDKNWIKIKKIIFEKIERYPKIALKIILEACNKHLRNIQGVHFEIFPDKHSNFSSRILIEKNGKYFSNQNPVILKNPVRAKNLSAKFCLLGLINDTLVETNFNYNF